MPAVGDVYFGTYNYEDGGASPKLIVLLYIDAEHDVAISCLVTKHEIKKDKATNIGCRPLFQRFFIPPATGEFDINSFLELSRNKIHKISDLDSAHDKIYKFRLSDQRMSEIKNCIKKISRDIPPDIFKLITV